ncbi:hypothetical protein EMIHUDRAFT_359915 [Emiliania huxleyi CCMP1516]|uniref:Secreted protein n=2 Tax=Emiliania huxleyi TaxID=2903 RepID=A0A0D3I303_EMIH1|nr:hypothetical protein EMIHUDRAFT_359915 [Emiliania huxleyi CCMP1516]EOD05638.1 hypothetical protein EMIHUDRAFT_359915 [Emiliania huxleyi CCMP1516]|eukprot:XP_005758067.1 hypothetical protein EMIHUDRAFT_359915 [Emiliania huxleyi CCMP1516]
MPTPPTTRAAGACCGVLGWACGGGGRLPTTPGGTRLIGVAVATCCGARPSGLISAPKKAPPAGGMPRPTYPPP